MGVLNVTPDSFSDAGKFKDPDNACEKALKMQEEGADIIDIGGESTRPGSIGVSSDEELKRILPVLERLKDKLKVPISVDTQKSEVASRALREGASIINDVSGLGNDKRIAFLCADYSAGLVIMHIKGSPKTMQRRSYYKNLLGEIKAYLQKGIKIATRAGLKKENIIIDPGIGFGKRLSHNLIIIRQLYYFKRLGFPLLLGLSRKSFIGKLLGLDVKDRLIPTIAADAIAVYNGADIIRVHDVKEAVMAQRIVDAIKRAVPKEKLIC